MDIRKTTYDRRMDFSQTDSISIIITAPCEIELCLLSYSLGKVFQGILKSSNIISFQELIFLTELLRVVALYATR